MPYRNSLMTTVLRDSLGGAHALPLAAVHLSYVRQPLFGSSSGNCRTVMVANITSAPDQLDESISTCRFAQRVAMVSCEVCS